MPRERPKEIATTTTTTTKDKKNKIKIKIKICGSSRCGSVEMNPTRNHEVAGSVPALAQGVKDLALP